MYFFVITIVLVCIQGQSNYADLAMQKGPAKNYGRVAPETKQKLDVQKGASKELEDDGHTVVDDQVAETKQ